MKYQLKEICSITKGAIGIMKADGGKYPLVALSDERRNHSEFQFDAKAVIVPLISSTGHGHASMKRVHYQEGKFALGNILCAVIPNDEKQLNAKFLHLYLQQFKETLLVPLMKGAANVSLPMNKLADVEIEVPSLERQLEIIALEDEAAEYKNELEVKLILQDGDVNKLRQAILREAMQGKLVKQNSKEGNSKDLLEKIRIEKNKLVKKEKPLPEIKEEEVPFDIPESWVWSRLGTISSKIVDGSHTPPKNNKSGIPMLSSQNILDNEISFRKVSRYVSEEDYRIELKRISIELGDVLLSTVGSIGRCAVVEKFEAPFTLQRSVAVIKTFILPKYLMFVIQSANLQKQINDVAWGVAVKGLYIGRIINFLIPIPPLPEQNRIVKKIEQLMQLCDELQYSIQQSKIENEKLLQGALRDALKK